MLSNEKLLNAVREHQLHFTLFSAEKAFSMYVPNTFIKALIEQEIGPILKVEYPSPEALVYSI
jgi:hypothetical protein